MKEQLISFETARLAKEKGFNLYLYSYWSTHDDEGQMNKILRQNEEEDNYNDMPYGPYISNKEELLYSAPSQSLLQKWLRDKHNIVVTITVNAEYYVDIYDFRKGLNGSHVFTGYFRSSNTLPTVDYIHGVIRDFTDWEEALEVGLQEGLKLI